MTSAAGADVLEPVALRAEEAISAPFRFTVDVQASSAALDPDTVLGLPACVTVAMPSGNERDFHGIVRSFHALGPGRRGGTWRYRAELVPKFWFASQTMDCRIFQNKTVVDILKTLFTENGVDATSIKADAKAAREYTVQYNETDYDFAVRLMEEEGYFWFFEHTSSAHTLVVADANTAFTTAPEPSVKVVPTGNAPDVLSVFGRATATAHGKIKLADYDPLNPSTAVEGEQETILATAGKAQRDVYRWPALTSVAATATSRARLRQEAAEAAATLCDGVGRNIGFAPGRKFTVTDDRLTGSDTQYVVHRIVHEANDDGDVAGAGVDSYSNSFDAFPAATPWRDWPRDRRPAMAGIHTAVVLGLDGEEIHTDKYGRIKVRFFWDHRKDATADDTIFIRVMQPWSGNTWGWQHLPRVGSEVAVAFVNGDPDSPIVVGSLYNAEQMPVFPLPDQKTKSGFRSRSTEKGGTADFNEWSFDDTKGSELVFFHAQKDFTEEVENDHSTHVMHDQTLKVDNVRIHKVGKTEDIDIGDAQTIKVGNGRTTTISKADEVLTVDPGNITVKASSGAIAHTAMQGYTIKSSTDSVKISAAVSIELSVGSNSIKIDNSGVAINGIMVKIAGTAMLDMKSPMSKLGGDGMLMLKGGIVMLN